MHSAVYPQDSRRLEPLQRARTLVRVLDQRLLDPLIGLIVPGGGDVISAMLGLYLFWVGARLALPRHLLARMLWNLALDLAAGSVPILGDVFDVAWRANTRNLALIDAHLQLPASETLPGSGQRAGGTVLLVGATLTLLAAVLLAVVAMVWALSSGLSRLSSPGGSGRPEL